MPWFTKGSQDGAKANKDKYASLNVAAKHNIDARLIKLQQMNARVLDISGKGYETQEVYNARKLHNALHLRNANMDISSSHGLFKGIEGSDDNIINELIRKADTIQLDQSEVDQVNTIKRVYTTLQLRAKNGKEYDARLGDYSRLLQGNLEATKKGWFSKSRNTFKYLRNASTTRKKNTEESIEIQQIRAYNEILGLILSITAKAYDKFKTRSTLEWLNKRFEKKTLNLDEKNVANRVKTELITNANDAGMYSLAYINPEYVYDIIARGKVRELVSLRDKYSKEFAELKKYPSILGVFAIGVYVLLTNLLHSMLLYGSPLLVITALTAYAIPVVVTVSILSYTVVSELRTLKTMTFKQEFIELHKILFNPANKIPFDTATQKDFFVYKQLSQAEKDAINKFKIDFGSGNPSDEQIMTYLNALLKTSQTRTINNILSNIPSESAAEFAPLAEKVLPHIVGWDLSYNEITNSFTYDCTSNDKITAWPDASKYGILNPEHCKTCPGAQCPVKIGGSRRNRLRKLRKTRRNQTYY
jgi:hypothetical protein